MANKQGTKRHRPDAVRLDAKPHRPQNPQTGAAQAMHALGWKIRPPKNQSVPRLRTYGAPQSHAIRRGYLHPSGAA
jgi:hypothetical protein